MKKLLLVFLVILSTALVLVGCKPKDKVFTSDEFSIVLPENFKQLTIDDTIEFSFSVERFDIAIIGLFIDKYQFNGSLNELARQSIAALPGSEKPTIMSDDQGSTPFLYVEYQQSVEGEDFSYYSVFLENDSKFFVIDFTTYTKSYKKNKNNFVKWSHSIQVEYLEETE